MLDRSKRVAWLAWAVGGALIALTLGAYAGVTELGFVRFDDPRYVTKNPQVQSGINADSLAWALTAGEASNWHPVTWLSHMLDVELYDLEPAGHHATSAAFHVLNVLLLFVLLRRTTGSVWRSAIVAALFAVHPLRVESVAWVSERKDVLSTSFALLSSLAYVGYARKGGAARYLASAALLGIGLMAKPMLVTLPMVFLLLDYWPLERWQPEAEPAPRRRGKGRPRIRPETTQGFGRLLVEKLPLLALSLASSAVTYLVQASGDSVIDEQLPFHLRIANAVVSYVRYLDMTLFPSPLGGFYPHPYMLGGEPLPWWQVAGAAILLLIITTLVLRARTQRYLAVGWLWYLGTLVPVIGLVQVGRQALADRYTYLPHMGLLIMAVWGGAALLGRLPRAARAVVFAGVGAVLGLLLWQSRLQVETWRDARSMVEHAIEVSPSSMMHYNFGNILVSDGDFEGAAEQYRAALAIQPLYPKASANLGSALLDLGRPEEAIAHYRAAIRLDHDYLVAHRGLGMALARSGDMQGAMEQSLIVKQLQQKKR